MISLRKIIREVLEQVNKVVADFDTMDIMLGDKVVGDFYAYKDKKGKYLTLSKIEIYPEYQKFGYATQAMDQIIDYANKNNLIIVLTPEAYKINSVSLKKSNGLSTAKLTKWYKSFGFIMNKGRNKDFETMQLMYKLPDTMEENNWPQSNMRNFIPPAYPTFPNPKDYDEFGNRIEDMSR
jgi:GNAT superfamily N-acetyltransferase